MIPLNLKKHRNLTLLALERKLELTKKLIGYHRLHRSQMLHSQTLPVPSKPAHFFDPLFLFYFFSDYFAS